MYTEDSAAHYIYKILAAMLSLHSRYTFKIHNTPVSANCTYKHYTLHKLAVARQPPRLWMHTFCLSCAMPMVQKCVQTTLTQLVTSTRDEFIFSSVKHLHLCTSFINHEPTEGENGTYIMQIGYLTLTFGPEQLSIS